MTGLYKINEIINNESYTQEDLIFILTYTFNIKSNDEFRLLCKVFNWLKKNVDLKIIDNKIIIDVTELECIYRDEGDDIFQFAKLIK